MASWFTCHSTSLTCPPSFRCFWRATSSTAPSSYPCPTCQTFGSTSTLVCVSLLLASSCSLFVTPTHTPSHRSGRRDHDSRSSIIVHLLQESIFEEIVTESLPQLIIQAVNQTLNEEWTNLGFASMFMSAKRFAPAHSSLFIARHFPAILCVMVYSGHQPWR